MTAIVGLVQEGKVWMGADSAASRNWTQGLLVQSKVFFVSRRKLLVGAVGTLRYLQIAQYHVDVDLPVYTANPHEVLVTQFIPALWAALKEHGAMTLDNTVENSGDSQMLVGYEGHLYSIDSSFSVAELARNFDAIGSGAEVALGALAVLPRLAPEKRILRALTAASKIALYVNPPFNVEHI